MGLWDHEIAFPDNAEIPSIEEFHEELRKHTGLKIDLKVCYPDNPKIKHIPYYRFYHRKLSDWDSIGYSQSQSVPIHMGVGSNEPCNSYLYMSICYLMVKHAYKANVKNMHIHFRFETPLDEFAAMIPAWAKVAFAKARKMEGFVPYGFQGDDE